MFNYDRPKTTKHNLKLPRNSFRFKKEKTVINLLFSLSHLPKKS